MGVVVPNLHIFVITLYVTVFRQIKYNDNNNIARLTIY